MSTVGSVVIAENTTLLQGTVGRGIKDSGKTTTPNSQAASIVTHMPMAYGNNASPPGLHQNSIQDLGVESNGNRQNVNGSMVRGVMRPDQTTYSSSSTSSFSGVKGTKRLAQDDADSQRLTKRFDSMRLGDGANKHFVPAQSSASKPDFEEQELMDIEDTKHRIFINNLDDYDDDDVESDEEHPIFIKDIEKHLAQVPRSILMNEADRERAKHMQMVLYRDPDSSSATDIALRKALKTSAENENISGSMDMDMDMDMS